MNRREFLAQMGGVFAAAALCPMPHGYDPKILDWKELSVGFVSEPPTAKPWTFREVKLMNISVVGAPTNFECRLEQAVSPDGPWEPVSGLPAGLRHVRAVYVNGESMPILRAGGYDEEEEGHEEEGPDERSEEEEEGDDEAEHAARDA